MLSNANANSLSQYGVKGIGRAKGIVRGVGMSQILIGQTTKILDIGDADMDIYYYT